jgi:hypothetical protein
MLLRLRTETCLPMLTLPLNTVKFLDCDLRVNGEISVSKSTGSLPCKRDWPRPEATYGNTSHMTQLKTAGHHKQFQAEYMIK